MVVVGQPEYHLLEEAQDFVEAFEVLDLESLNGEQTRLQQNDDVVNLVWEVDPVHVCICRNGTHLFQTRDDLREGILQIV